MPLMAAVANTGAAASPAGLAELAHWQALLPQPVTVEVDMLMAIYLFASTAC
jgi:hypothetical protein